MGKKIFSNGKKYFNLIFKKCEWRFLLCTQGVGAESFLFKVWTNAFGKE